ncbi:hypothetical protein ACIQZM_09075, partial [Peribacillus sp. NPDC097206]|uniref:hypothetical protein n=1 Tax=Peribacillus sp. NPDC097206 TaxID=3364398 RepID=UPI0037F2ADC1
MSSSAAQQDAVELEVKNVKAENGKVVTTTKKEFTFFDASTPVVSETRVVGPRKVEVTFSEPLEVAPTVKLDSGSISSTVTLNSADRTKAIVEFGIEPSVGEHSIEIENGADYAGFKIEKTTKTFTYAKDAAVPTVSVEKAAPGSVTLKFSKPVAVKSAANVSVYHTINNSGAYVGSSLTPANEVNGYADTFTVTFATPLAEGTSNVFLNTAANALEDEWGNDVASAQLSASVVIDKVAPQVTSVTAATDSKFEVAFSKEVVEEDAELAANFTLTDADGKTVSLTGASFEYNNTKKVTTITLPSNLKPGTYALTAKNITDTTFAKNKLTSQTVSVVVPDTTKWNIAEGSVVLSGDKKKIRVQFNEAMSAEGLATLSNYSLRTAEDVAVGFPENTKIVVVNSSTVEIQLGEVLPVSATQLRVSGSLKDSAGNIRSNTDSKLVAISTDSIVLVDNKAKTTSTTTVTFQLDQELQGSLNPANFKIDGEEVFGGASYVNNAGKSTVTLTLKDIEGNKFAPNQAPTINAVAGSFKNVFGTENEPLEINAADGIAPTVEKNSDGKLKITNNTATPVSDFAVDFDETLGASNALWASDLVITAVDGETLKAGDDFTVSSSSDNLVVTLAGDYAKYADALTVSSVKAPAYIRDLAGNTAKSFAATTVTVTNTQAAIAEDLATAKRAATAKEAEAGYATKYTAATRTAVDDAQALPEGTDAEKATKTEALNDAVAGLVT